MKTAGGAEQVEYELNRTFNPEQSPLARAVLLRHNELESRLFFTFHHSIGDAMSGAYVMRDLFRAVAGAEQGLDPELPPLSPKKAMNAYFPAWARGWPGTWRYTKLSLRILSSLLIKGRPTTPHFDAGPASGRWRARIAAHELDGDLVNRLHHKARQENTTLHGALLAAQILAMAEDRADRGARNYFVGSPVNLRRKLSPPVQDDVGFFVTMGFSMNRVRPGEDFWALAGEIRKSLWDCVECGDPFLYVIQHQQLSIFTRLLGLGTLGRHVYSRVFRLVNMGGMAFSNIGRVDLEIKNGGIVMESLGFAASGAGASPLMAFASTLGDKTCWNFVGMEPVISRDHTISIADKALRILIRAV